jgi:hypothetical protein
VQLGRGGGLLAGEHILSLRCPVLSVELLSMGAHSLPLPKITLSLEWGVVFDRGVSTRDGTVVLA